MCNRQISILEPFAAWNELQSLALKFGTDKVRYCPVYEMYLRPNRERPINLLEIGVGGHDDPKDGGHSLRMWKAYFSLANIFGIDIYDKSLHQEERIAIFQGSQDDGEFLRSVVAAIGRVDVIVDDGSHHSNHVIKSFEVLFPLLAEGGIYIVEDIATSYWPEWSGSINLDAKTTTMAYFKRLADGIQSIHFKHPYSATYADSAAKYVHFYENFIVIGKKL